MAGKERTNESFSALERSPHTCLLIYIQVYEHTHHERFTRALYIRVQEKAGYMHTMDFD